MNLLKMFSMAVILFFVMASCSNEELDSSFSISLPPSTKSIDHQTELSVTAGLLASIEIDQEIMNEVKVGVERSLKYGLDEEYRFRDMLKPANSKFSRSTKKSNLIQKMNDQLNLSSQLSRKSNDINDFFNFLFENDVQIYWPYSEEWDGKEFPTITFNPENGNTDWNYGYKRKKGVDGRIFIDTVVVNEDYFMKQPVWIINRNEIKYENLPDFEKGIYEKNGVIFDQPVDNNIDSKNATRALPWVPETNPNLNYSFYIQNMRVYKQLDGAFAGGSEMLIQCSYPEIEGGMKAPVTVLRKSWTRKEISKSKIKPFTTPLITNWRQEQLQCGLKIVEEDNGSGNNWEFSLGFATKGNNYTISAKIPFQNNDDEIVQVILDRSYINSTSNISNLNSNEWGIWKMYSEGGVAYSLPILTNK